MPRWPRRLPPRAAPLRPVAVHPLPRLSAALGGGVEIWAKREDCNSGIAFGGNKVRKLEYLAAEALATGLRHARVDRRRAVQPHPRRHRRRLPPRPAAPSRCRSTGSTGTTRSTSGVGNIQLTRIMGGDVRMDAAGFDIGVRDSWQAALESVRAAGGTPYAIPAGASDHPLGGLGFANWAREVAAQEARARRVLRHRRRVHRHRLDARRDDRRLRPRGPRRPPGHRHRRLQDAGQDRRPGHPHRHRHGRAHRARPRACAPTRSRSSTATPARSTASPTSRRSRPSTSPRGPRGCSPTRSTRASRWPG